MGKLNVDGTEIQVLQIEEDDYISLTDMVRKIDNGSALIEKWLRNKNTIEFLGIWEEMYNADFNAAAYEEIMLEAGLNRFIMSVKQWVSRTNSKGIVAKAGRYGGTYAYKDIAFEFASWVSPQFKLYLIKEFERLKKEEQALLGWSAKKELAKINYRIHTDAIKVNLIPCHCFAVMPNNAIFSTSASDAYMTEVCCGVSSVQEPSSKITKKGSTPTVMNPTKFIVFPYTGILSFGPVILIHPIQKAFSAFPDPIYTRERIDSMPVSALALQKPSLVIHPCWQM